MAYIDYQQATITGGSAQSSAIDVGGHVVTGFITDANWDTAAMSFLASADGVTYYKLYNGSTELSYAAFAASLCTIHDPVLFIGVRYLKVRSGTAGAEVNQVGDTVVTVLSRPI